MQDDQNGPKIKAFESDMARKTHFIASKKI
jgi:hypothetical protein